LSEKPPTFSVVIPTYNRLSLLKRTLESLFRQECDSYEIIVVSDGSTDGSHEYLTALASEGKLFYFSQQNQGPALARNLGIQHARGTHIAFIDDDCIAPPDWLKQYAESFEATDVAGIGGSSRTGNTSSIFAVVNDLIVNFFKENINTRADVPTPFLTSNNAAYKKSSLDNIGGFHKDFKRGAEERDLNFRLTQAGEKLLYDASIVIDHVNDADFIAFVKHQFEQGRGSYLLYANARKQTGKQPGMIPLKVYLGLFLYPFKHFPAGKALILFLLLIVTQIAIVAGYAAQSLSAHGK
jgi:glycosyltransferase involved in cell wall biosynthesis